MYVHAWLTTLEPRDMGSKNKYTFVASFMIMLIYLLQLKLFICYVLVRSEIKIAISVHNLLQSPSLISHIYKISNLVSLSKMEME